MATVKALLRKKDARTVAEASFFLFADGMSGPRRLALDDGTGGASVGASAAADASILVNLVDVAFGDSSNGAFASASATGNAGVGNSVSHFNLVF